MITFSLNPLLLPGVMLLKSQGKVVKLVFLQDEWEVPDRVDEIAVCLSDYEDLKRIVDLLEAEC